ncbi:MAG: acyl-CoA dehydrogenase family protein [Candidatus Eremiobacteraeota bacterium]|nr:acyl-CoA dehydrogenase family protein [Candidatus Eremiobacteraeota bacterium]
MHQVAELQNDYVARARSVAEQIAPFAAETDRTEAYPWTSVDALRSAGLMGMTIPRDYGGLGVNYLEAVRVIEELSKVCGATGRIAVESNMGAIGAIMRYGTAAQTKLAASLVLSGDKPAICITEPDAGSAASEMTTRADRHGDRYLINGKKHWITGGGVSKLHLIFARVFDESGTSQGIGGFIVVRQAAGEPPGLIVGRRLPAMGIRGIPEAEVTFENLDVPAGMMLAASDDPARGFARLMEAYNAQRVGAAAVALGIAQGAFDLAVAYVKERRQFGRPICEFQGLQWMLADMSIALAAARALVHEAAASGSGEGNFPDMLAAARAKVLAADTAIKVTNDALQLFGAAGYSRDLPLERMVRDARMFTISGGTAQVLRTQIAGRILGRKLPQTRDGYGSA